MYYASGKVTYADIEAIAKEFEEQANIGIGSHFRSGAHDLITFVLQWFVLVHICLCIL